MNLGETVCEDVNCIQLRQDRVYRRDSMSKIMYVPFPRKWEYLNGTGNYQHFRRNLAPMS
jgi:hypothetical protein